MGLKTAFAAFASWFLKEKPAECDHRFRAEDVADFNIDPQCTKCGKWSDAIQAGRPAQFQAVDDKEYKIIFIKP